MRKAKEQHDDVEDTHYFEDFEADDSLDDESVDERDPRQRRRPARQRVELRNEQQSLRRQLSDWDDYDNYGQDDFDTKL